MLRGGTSPMGRRPILSRPEPFRIQMRIAKRSATETLPRPAAQR